MHNARTNVIPISRSIGDYLMVRKTGRHSHKLGAKWHGPMRVVWTVNHAMFTVQNLTGDKMEVVHAQRFMQNSLLQTEQPVTQRILEQAQHSERVYHAVERLDDVLEARSEYQVHVKWLGWEEHKSTWEPSKTMIKDVPSIVEELLSTPGKAITKKKNTQPIFKMNIHMMGMHGEL